MTRTQKAIELGNQPAFPAEVGRGDFIQTGDERAFYFGLTKREYGVLTVTGHIAAALIGRPDAVREIKGFGISVETWASKLAIDQTDDALEQLAKDQP